MEVMLSCVKLLHCFEDQDIASTRLHGAAAVHGNISSVQSQSTSLMLCFNSAFNTCNLMTPEFASCLHPVETTWLVQCNHLSRSAA